nr:ATP-binding protein [Campylobacter coli]
MTVSPKYLICYLLVGFIQKFYSIIGIGAVLRIDQPFTNGFTANLFFNLIAKRYEKSSTLITTNLTFSKWPEVFGDPVLTNALLDRLLHHSQVLNINGPSYRLKDQLQLMTDDD